MMWLTINFITQFFGCVQCGVQHEKGTGTIISKELKNGEYMDCDCLEYNKESYQYDLVDVICFVYNGNSSSCGPSVRIFSLNSFEENLSLEFYENDPVKRMVYVFTEKEVQKMQICFPNLSDTGDTSK